MRNRSLNVVAALLLLALLPFTANAASWFFNTWAKSAGGAINSRNMVNQTSAAGSIYRSYTTHAPLDVTVTANTGYTISNVTVNGVVISSPASPYATTVQGMSSQSLFATFAARRLSVTATAGPGGTVSPASVSNIYYGSKSYSPINFRFVPASGYRVAAISGVPAGASVSSALPAATNTTVTVTLPTTFTFTADIALVGAFSGPPKAVVGAPQVVLPATPVTLDGSASERASSWFWSQTNGPGFPGYKVIADNTPGSTVGFTPAAVGTYNFRLTVDGGSMADTYVVVTDDPAAVARSQCQNCHQAVGIGATDNVFNKWSTSLHRPNLVMCANCHVGADSGGHPGALTSGKVDEATFNYIGTTDNFCVTCHNPSTLEEFAGGKHFSRAGSASCSFCHEQGVHNPGTACVNCHSPVNSYGLPWPPSGLEFHSDYTGTNLCSNCHNTHSAVATGCGGCHDFPPATASHLKHYGNPAIITGYGDLRITGTFANYTGGYLFGCGNCHPLDSAKHRNGSVEVELHNPSAAPGSIKAMHPESASYVPGPEVFTDSKGLPYTKGTCSNIYCRSSNRWTTTEAIPEQDPNWQSKAVANREYKTVTWGGGALTCSGCHGNPTQSSYESNDGGAGDSHSWMDDQGYQNLHTYNMGFEPISCRYCHNDTVKQVNGYSEDGMGVRTFHDVPIASYSKHVNGSADVAFDKQSPLMYRSPMSLSTAIYDKSAKSCSNVSCHLQQTTVQWGTPYRWWYNYECDVCHQY